MASHVPYSPARLTFLTEPYVVVFWPNSNLFLMNLVISLCSLVPLPNKVCSTSNHTTGILSMDNRITAKQWIFKLVVISEFEFVTLFIKTGVIRSIQATEHLFFQTRLNILCLGLVNFNEKITTEKSYYRTFIVTHLIQTCENKILSCCSRRWIKVFTTTVNYS